MQTMPSTWIHTPKNDTDANAQITNITPTWINKSNNDTNMNTQILNMIPIQLYTWEDETNSNTQSRNDTNMNTHNTNTPTHIPTPTLTHEYTNPKMTPAWIYKLCSHYELIMSFLWVVLARAALAKSLQSILLILVGIYQHSLIIPRTDEQVSK